MHRDERVCVISVRLHFACRWWMDPPNQCIRLSLDSIPSLDWSDLALRAMKVWEASEASVTLLLFGSVHDLMNMLPMGSMGPRRDNAFRAGFKSISVVYIGDITLQLVDLVWFPQIHELSILKWLLSPWTETTSWFRGACCVLSPTIVLYHSLWLVCPWYSSYLLDYFLESSHADFSR